MPKNDQIVEFFDRGNKVQTLLSICAAEPTPDNIHDLRVAIRRYLAALDCLKNCTPKLPTLKKERAAIKSLLDAYDEIRDLHVMIDHLTDNPRVFKPSSPFLSYLLTQVERIENNENIFAKEDARRASKNLAKVNKAVKNNVKKITKENSYTALDSSFARVNHHANTIDQQDPDTVHRLRIAFKKFRYSVEFFSSQIETPPEDLFPRLRQLQTVLGEVQDASVLCQTMEQFASMTDIRLLNAVEQSYAKERLSAAIDAVIKALPKFKTLWRVDRSHPLPWLSEPTPNELSDFIDKFK